MQVLNMNSKNKIINQKKPMTLHFLKKYYNEIKNNKTKTLSMSSFSINKLKQIFKKIFKNPLKYLISQMSELLNN